MKPVPKFLHSTRRVIIGVAIVIALLVLGYFLWQPGMDVRDGRHDRGCNAIWIAHGWLGADEWFVRNNKTNQLIGYREARKIGELAEKLRRHGIRDVYPHLCPADASGQVPATDREQVERFLDIFGGFRVMPWIGGPNGGGADIHDPTWRIKFVKNVRVLLLRHKRFSGIHLNIEPLPSGDRDFLLLLDELHAALPEGKILSVAAYPPPTSWHRFPDVHWDENYFREVARHCDQLAVMMYDAGQKIPKTYERLMADWTKEVLQCSEGKPVLLGVPSYEDADRDYHNPNVENVAHALRGIHAGLSGDALPANYQGIAIYSDWETSELEWQYLEEHFLRQPGR